MGKKVYTINGKMFLVDDETGEIKVIRIENESISPSELKEIIKLLAKPDKDK
jgi:hypothetical protein